jgi:hypothetical protein
MKKWWLSIVFLLVVGCVTSTTQTKEDGYLERSRIDPRRTIQYDKDGKVEGYWQKSYIDPRRSIFYKKKD